MPVPATPDSLILEDYIPYLLHQAHLSMMALFSSTLTEHGLTLPEWRVLTTIHARKSLRFREIVAATGLEPPTLVRVIDKLEKLGHLTRSKSDTDRRGTLVSITPEGYGLTGRVIPRAYEAQAMALSDFSVDEAELLRRLLRRIPTNAQQAPRD